MTGTMGGELYRRSQGPRRFLCDNRPQEHYHHYRSESSPPWAKPQSDCQIAPRPLESKMADTELRGHRKAHQTNPRREAFTFGMESAPSAAYSNRSNEFWRS